MGQQMERTVRLFHRKGAQLKIANCIAPKNVEIDFENKEGHVNLSISAKYEVAGAYKEQILILFEQPDRARVSIPLYALVKDN